MAGADQQPAGAQEPFDNHGGVPLRGMALVPRSSTDAGRFGRLFRTLPPFLPTDAALNRLAASMTGSPADDADPAGDNPDIPAGYTYLGQLIDHDITFDSASVLERANDPEALENARTPRYDLDSLYGGGQKQSPWLYDEEDPVKLLIGKNTATIHEPEDLPRNQQGRALMPDPREDVHVIISQLHLALIRFHNAIVDHLRDRFFPDFELAAEARRLTSWHYQWIVLHDFLPRLVGQDLIDEILVPLRRSKGWALNLRFYSWRRAPWIPLEFSAAAYRWGHSAVRPSYKLNGPLEPIPMFSPAMTPNPLQHLGGFRPLPKRWKVDWSLFFPIGGSAPQLGRRIDTTFSSPLKALPVTIDKPRRSLVLLNFLRGRALQLPSGQAVARAMGTSVPDADLGIEGDVPLYFYFLREAQVLADGRRLGPTGGRIIAEVMLGLLNGDPSSFLRKAPGWAPELPSSAPGTFTMPDLLEFAVPFL